MRVAVEKAVFNHHFYESVCPAPADQFSVQPGPLQFPQVRYLNAVDIFQGQDPFAGNVPVDLGKIKGGVAGEIRTELFYRMALAGKIHLTADRSGEFLYQAN